MHFYNSKLSIDYPSIDTLVKVVDSKYTLVVLAAKRARELLNRDYQLGEDTLPRKAVSVALEEIADGRITFERYK